jgi:TolB-like protein
VIGAFATIVLGLIVVEQYHSAKFANGIQSEHSAKPVDTRTAEPVDTGTNAASATRKTSGKPSIAVLPLENFSADAAHQYIANGLTDALVAELALADELRVVSRTSSMQYRGQPKNLTDIGRELGRVIVQLIRAESDEHLWARSYDRSVGDLLAVEADLARTISADLRDVLKQVIEERTSRGAILSERPWTGARPGGSLPQ